METKAETAKQPHKRRSDTGPRLIDRDLAALRWIAQQYAIRLDHLCILLARLIPQGAYTQTPKSPGRLTEKRTITIIRRWQARDLIHIQWILHSEPPWVYLTQEGLRLVASEVGAFRPYAPKPSMIAHLYYCNHARLFIEQRRPDAHWTSDRELHRNQKRGHGVARPHIPDAEVLTNAKVLAIEVELTVKAPSVLAKILGELAVNDHYATIWYFTKGRTTNAVNDAIATLPETYRGKFVVYDFDEMPL